MQKITLFVALILVGLTTKAQKIVPQITTGTVLNYTAFARAFGQTLPAILTISDMNAPLRMKWSIGGLGTGTFEISAKAIQSADRMALREPGFEEVTKLKDNETIAFLSKDTFNALVTNKAFELNGQKFTVIPDAPAFVLETKELDSFYAETENKKTKIWVLNDPAFPLIVKLEGAKQGIDLVLNSIK